MDSLECPTDSDTRFETLSNSSWTVVDDDTSSERENEEVDLISPAEKGSKEVDEEVDEDVEEEVECSPKEEEVDEEVDGEEVDDDDDADVDLVVEFVHDSGYDVDELIDQIISSSESDNDDAAVAEIVSNGNFAMFDLDLIDDYVAAPEPEAEEPENEVAAAESGTAENDVVVNEVAESEVANHRVTKFDLIDDYVAAPVSECEVVESAVSTTRDEVTEDLSSPAGSVEASGNAVAFIPDEVFEDVVTVENNALVEDTSATVESVEVFEDATTTVERDEVVEDAVSHVETVEESEDAVADVEEFEDAVDDIESGEVFEDAISDIESSGVFEDAMSDIESSGVFEDATDNLASGEVIENAMPDVEIGEEEEVEVLSAVEKIEEGEVVDASPKNCDLAIGSRIPGDPKDMASDVVFEHDFDFGLRTKPRAAASSGNNGWAKMGMDTRMMYLLSNEKRQRRKISHMVAACGFGVLVLGYLCSSVAALQSEVGQLQTQIDHLRTRIDSSRVYRSDVARYELSNAMLQTSVDSVLSRQRKVEHAVASSEARIDSLATQLTDVNTTCHLFKHDATDFAYSLGVGDRDSYSHHTQKRVSNLESNFADRLVAVYSAA